MKVRETEKLNEQQKMAAYELWNTEYPAQLANESINELEQYLSKLSEQKHYLLMQDDDTIAGWAFSFNRDTERWFAIIVKRDAQGKGYGSLLLKALKENEAALNGWVSDHDRHKKADGTTYTSPLAFYEKNGFTLHPDIRLDNEKVNTIKISWRKSPA